jgi:hypothetical protein
MCASLQQGLELHLSWHHRIHHRRLSMKVAPSLTGLRKRGRYVTRMGMPDDKSVQQQYCTVLYCTVLVWN